MTMLLVVYSHVLVYTCHTASGINNFFMLGRMPLFFFISGYFSWSEHYDVANFRKRVGRRLSRQLYPTIFVMVIFALTMRRVYNDPLRNISYAFHDPLKFGYWFTISLVEVFIVFAIMARWMDAAGYSRHTRISLMSGMVALSAIPLLTGVTFEFSDKSGIGAQTVQLLSLSKTMTLAPYFFMGVLAKMGGEAFRDAAASPRFLQCSLTCTAIFGTLSLSGQCGVATGLISLLSGTSTMALFFAIFSSLRDRLQPGNIIADTLATIGRDTLPVYLFHYFIVVGLWEAMPDFGRRLAQFTGTPWLELPVIGSVALLVSICVIGIDHIAKKIPYLHKAIFTV